MRLLTILIIICSIACTRKYPPENYIIAEKYRALIASYTPDDTLKFQDKKHNLFTFLIVGIDSSFHEENNGIMKSRGLKDIVVYCRELTNPRMGYDEYPLFILNRYPDENEATFDVRLKDFYNMNTTDPFVTHGDTVTANDISFTNYYHFTTYDPAPADSNVVSDVYMTTQEGIIAYRTIKGDWWTKTN